MGTISIRISKEAYEHLINVRSRLSNEYHLDFSIQSIASKAILNMTTKNILEIEGYAEEVSR